MPKLCKKVIKPSLHNEFTKIVTVETSFSDYFLAQQKNVSLALDMRTPDISFDSSSIGLISYKWFLTIDAKYSSVKAYNEENSIF